MKRNRVQNISAILWMSTVFCTFLSIASVEVSWTAEQPQYRGILTFAVGTQPPTKDGHMADTFGLIHPCSPHYSLLLKFDEDNYPKIIGDLAENWTISNDHKIYTFKIRRGVKFHDGSVLTSKDIKASYDKIIFPPSGVVSFRKAFYSG